MREVQIMVLVEVRASRTLIGSGPIIVPMSISMESSYLSGTASKSFSGSASDITGKADTAWC